MYDYKSVINGNLKELGKGLLKLLTATFIVLKALGNIIYYLLAYAVSAYKEHKARKEYA